MSEPAQETSNQRIVRENLMRPASERLSLESLKKMGVISRVDVIVFHEGKEWSVTEYFDYDRIILEEILAGFAVAFERTLEKEKK